MSRVHIGHARQKISDAANNYHKKITSVKVNMNY